jgi:hypothetical protein
MKIKNTSQQDLNLSINKLNGEKIIVNMKPNQVLYTENGSEINKQILIYEKKRIINVNRENDKPDFVNYYKSFFESGTFKISKPAKIALEDDEDDLEEALNEFEVLEIPKGMDSYDEDLDEDMPAEKKGRGRPKGTAKIKTETEDSSQPKKGRGRPKGTVKVQTEEKDSSESKKGRGRPKGSVKTEKKTIIQVDIESVDNKKRGRPRKLQLTN